MIHKQIAKLLIFAVLWLSALVLLTLTLSAILRSYDIVLEDEASKSPCETGEGIIAGMPCREED